VFPLDFLVYREGSSKHHNNGVQKVHVDPPPPRFL
jgi:hypothetical protein